MTRPTLEEMMRYQEAFVKPMVDAVQVEMRSHISTMAVGQAELTAFVRSSVGGLMPRIDKLEGNQKKAMVGWGVFASGLSIAVTAAWGWIRSKIQVR